jgi:pimeloyl-ACP methyl ester carboxylesterase
LDSPTVDETIPGRPPDESFEVAVPGGALAVGRWGSGAVSVVCSHGITANHRSFDSIATALVDRGIGVVAVDHRGRGGSADAPGPFGLVAHADDLVTVADVLDIDRPVLVGHSMGAWVVANAAERAPGRWRGVVAVDGALPVARDLPPDVDVEEVLAATIGPALARLDMTFPTPDDALDLWRAHPAVGPVMAAADGYLRWDLHEVDGTWRSRVSKSAVLADGRATLVDADAATALRRVDVPTTVVWAARGLLDETPGFLSPEDVATHLDPLPHVVSVHVPDVNHYSIVFAPTGVQAVVAAVLAHLGA